MSRFRFSAARRPQGLRIQTASRQHAAPIRGDEDDDWMDEDDPLEIIDGELALPAPDPDAKKITPLPPPFKIGFGLPDERPLPPRSI